MNNCKNYLKVTLLLEYYKHFLVKKSITVLNKIKFDMNRIKLVEK